MASERTLIVGSERQDFDELRTWLQRQGRRAWFARHALSALRSFEELEPAEVIIDTGLPGGDPERLARILRSTAPDLRITFLVQHVLEANYYASLEGLGAVRVEFRPIDPWVLFGIQSEEDARTIDGIPPVGRLSSAGLIDLIAALLRRRETGVLYLNHGRTRKILYVLHGEITWVESNILAENFGQFLLRRSMINGIELNWARGLQMRENIRQGEALVKIGVLKPESLDELLAEQIRDKAGNALRMPIADYRFSHDRHFIAARPRIAIHPIRLFTEALLGSALLPSEEEFLDRTLRLHPGLDDQKLLLLSTALSAGARDAIRSGASFRAVAEAEGHVPQWGAALALALEKLGFGTAVPTLDDVAQAALLGIPEPGEASDSESALSESERIREIQQLLDRADDAQPWLLADLEADADRDAIIRRLNVIEARLASPGFGRGLPVTATAALSTLLDRVQSARERLLGSTDPDTAPDTPSNEDAEALLLDALEFIDRGAHADALRILDGLVHDFPRHGRFHVHQALARFLAHQGSTGDERTHSLLLVRRIIERDPTNADAYFALGTMLNALKHVDEARTSFEACLALDAGHEGARRALDALG